MGIIDNLSNFFRSSKNASVVQEEDMDKKSVLATQIVDLVGRIKEVNCFDSSIWNLNKATSYELTRRSLDELEQLHSSLSRKLLQLTKQKESGQQKREALEEAKWTGQKPKNLTTYEFDRFQRDER